MHAQSIIRSTVAISGSSETVVSNNKSYYISQSIGQASVIGTVTSNGYTIRQGFQQPPISFIIGQLENGSDLDAIVFPNPFQQMVHISFKDKNENDVWVIMHDITGRIILNKRFEASRLITLPLDEIGSGDYILNVTTGEKHLTTSIIKQ